MNFNRTFLGFVSFLIFYLAIPSANANSGRTEEIPEPPHVWDDQRTFYLVQRLISLSATKVNPADREKLANLSARLGRNKNKWPHNLDLVRQATELAYWARQYNQDIQATYPAEQETVRTLAHILNILTGDDFARIFPKDQNSRK